MKMKIERNCSDEKQCIWQKNTIEILHPPDIFQKFNSKHPKNSYTAAPKKEAGIAIVSFPRHLSNRVDQLDSATDIGYVTKREIVPTPKKRGDNLFKELIDTTSASSWWMLMVDA